jgi:hypothetical protein
MAGGFKSFSVGNFLGSVVAHALGGAEHLVDTLANLNSKISDATLDDAGDPRPPTAHTHTHASTTGQTADDHHNRQHGLGAAADHTSATLAQLNALLSDANLGLTKGLMRGLGISNNATTPDEQVDIAAGLCRNDADDGDIAYAGGTIDITASGANGLDTGSVAANTFYAVWLIWHPTGPVVAGLLSASFSSPTLPGGYTKKRRIGVVKTDATSDLYLFKQFGEASLRRYFWDTIRSNVQVLTGGNDTSWTDVDLSAWLPPISQQAILLALFDPTDVNNIMEMRPDGSANASPPCYIQSAKDPSSVYLEMCTDDSQILEYQVTNIADSADIWVRGFIDDI